MSKGRALACVLSILGVAVGRAGAEQPAAPAAPHPGPEHVLLQKEVGTWDASVEAAEAPGKAPSLSKGVETDGLMAGGLWLITTFKSSFMNQPFEGHGVAGYDPAKKKYVSSWVDSFSSGVSLGESSYDPATKKMSGWMEGPDVTGKLTKTRMETEWKDATTRVFTMWAQGPDGKESVVLKITYKRRK
jgi:hypothetical protein